MILPDHPAIKKIQEIITKRQKEVDDKPMPSLSDPPIIKKASKLLNPALFNKLPALTKKLTKSIGPIKSVPEPQSPTKPTKIPHKYSLNHTSDSWKPE